MSKRSKKTFLKSFFFFLNVQSRLVVNCWKINNWKIERIIVRAISAHYFHTRLHFHSGTSSSFSYSATTLSLSVFSVWTFLCKINKYADLVHLFARVVHVGLFLFFSVLIHYFKCVKSNIGLNRCRKYMNTVHSRLQKITYFYLSCDSEALECSVYSLCLQ